MEHEVAGVDWRLRSNADRVQTFMKRPVVRPIIQLMHCKGFRPIPAVLDTDSLQNVLANIKNVS